MKRRDFIKTISATAIVMAMPEYILSSLSGLAEEEIEAKVKELLSKMTLDEKIEQMAGKITLGHMLRRAIDPTYADTWDTPENKRLGIPPLRCIDGPRGVGTGFPTCFPVSMCRGATWDPELELNVGSVMGYEGRSMGVNVLLGPCINLLWHPSWGRAQETYGEDPYHIGVMGASNVVGLQKHLMACPKHFAVNNIEQSRMFVNAKVDERTLREIFLPHFKMCVDAKAASIMSAYNDVNGYLCAHNKHLLRDILKGEWGFKGFVVSDWVTAVEDAVEAANGGLDLEMPSPTHFGKPLKKAVLEGKVSEATIDEAVTRILRQKLKFIKENYTAGYDRKKKASKEHTDVALEVARKGIVLLKNENNALPIIRENVKTILVAGPLAQRANLGDMGSSAVRPPYAISPLKGIRNKARNVRVIYDSGVSLETLKNTAKNADAVIVVAGMTFKDEGEGNDREDLSLHERDKGIINAVSAVNKRTIVVLEAGSAITMDGWIEKVQAILMAWYPGMEGGNAIAEIIFGDVNPSGKLPIVFPKSLDQLPKFDNKAKEVIYEGYHGYRYFEKKGLEPLFPFGFGLSYTKFGYANLKLNKKKITKKEKIEASVEVTNTGDRAGDEIVQLYVGYKGSKVERPVKELKAFKRVSLAPSETKTVSLEVKAEDLAYFNVEKNCWEIEEIEYIVYVGPSSKNEELLSDSFKIIG